MKSIKNFIAAALMFFALSAGAQTPDLSTGVTYKYSGNNFMNVVDNPSVPGTYDTSMRVSGKFTLGSALPPNRPLNDVDVIPLSFKFSDGRSAITNLNAKPIRAFRVATDAAGDITQWYILLETLDGVAQTTIQTIRESTPLGTTFDQGNVRSDVSTTNEDYAWNTAMPGSWLSPANTITCPNAPQTATPDLRGAVIFDTQMFSVDVLASERLPSGALQVDVRVSTLPLPNVLNRLNPDGGGVPFAMSIYPQATGGVTVVATGQNVGTQPQYTSPLDIGQGPATYRLIYCAAGNVSFRLIIDELALERTKALYMLRLLDAKYTGDPRTVIETLSTIPVIKEAFEHLNLAFFSTTLSLREKWNELQAGLYNISLIGRPCRRDQPCLFQQYVGALFVAGIQVTIVNPIKTFVGLARDIFDLSIVHGALSLHTEPIHVDVRAQ